MAELLSLFMEMNRVKKGIVFSFLCLLIGIVALNFELYPALERNQFENIGMMFESIILIVVVIFFLLVQVAPINKIPYTIISFGLAMWAGACALDVSDEFIKQPLWLAMWGEDACRTVGMLCGTFGSFLLIKDSLATYAEVHRLSTIDDLTQLYNRRYFKQELKNKESQSLTIILIDVDEFKTINDTHGHQQGDKVLSHIANALTELLEWKFEGFAARIGGDEFACCLFSDDRNIAKAFVQDFMRYIRTINIANEALSVSIGISMKSGSESTVAIIQNADNALYISKRKGKNRFTFYEDELEAKS